MRYHDKPTVSFGRPARRARLRAFVLLAAMAAGLATPLGSPAGNEKDKKLPGPRLMSRIGTPAFNHPRMVLAAAFSPDGKELASVCDDGVVRLWELPGGRQRLAVPRDYTYVTRPALAFSPDGTMLALAGDGTIRVWRASTGDEVVRLKETLKSWSYRIAFSGAGRTLTAWLRTGEEVVWELPSGQQVSHSDAKTGPVWTGAYSAERKLLAIGRNDGTVSVLDTALGKTRFGLEGYLVHSSNVSPVLDFSPDGRALAVGCDTRTNNEGHKGIHVFETEGGKRILALPLSARAMAFSADSRRLVTVSREGDVALWELATGKELHHIALSGTMAWVTCVTLSPDGKTVAVGAGQRLEVWDLAANKELSHVPGPREPIRSLAFLPDNSTVAITTSDDLLTLWDARTGKELHRLARPCADGRKLQGLALTLDVKILASTVRIGEVALWEVPSGRQLALLEKDGYPAHTLTFSPDGKLLVWDAGGQALIFDTETGQELASWIGAYDRITVWAFSPDGKRLLTACPKGSRFEGRLWDVTERKELGLLKGSLKGVQSFAFSPDSQTLAAGCDDHTIRFWDVRTRELVRTLKVDDGQRNIVVRYAPDGKTLAWGGSRSFPPATDRAVHLLNTETGKETARLDAQEGGIAFLAFSPDGTRLAIAGLDNTVHVWDLALTRRSE